MFHLLLWHGRARKVPSIWLLVGWPFFLAVFFCSFFFGFSFVLWTCRNAFHSCLSAGLVLAWWNRFGPPCVVTLPAILPVHSDKWPTGCVCASLSIRRSAPSHSLSLSMGVYVCVGSAFSILPFGHRHKLTFSDFKGLLKVKLRSPSHSRFSLKFFKRRNRISRTI